MFRLKICGITHRPDVEVACALGADAIGLNFYERSKRYLPPAFAASVAAKIPPGVARVGIFVDTPASEVCQIFDRVRLDFIQLCGDEPADYLPDLAGRPVLKSIRFGEEGLKPAEQFIAAARKTGTLLAGIVIDASEPGQFGGTGATLDWTRLRGELNAADLDGLPLVLAGGLTPLNVAEAIATVRPAAVDVASGVEYAPGRKDARLVDQFLTAAQAAFAEVD